MGVNTLVKPGWAKAGVARTKVKRPSAAVRAGRLMGIVILDLWTDGVRGEFGVAGKDSLGPHEDRIRRLIPQGL